MKTLEESFKRLNEQNQQAETGGGQEKIDKIHKAGRKTARER